MNQDRTERTPFHRARERRLDDFGKINFSCFSSVEADKDREALAVFRIQQISAFVHKQSDQRLEMMELLGLPHLH